MLRNISLLTIFYLCASTVELQAQDRFHYSQSEADAIIMEFNTAMKTYHPFAFRSNGSERLDSMAAVVHEDLAVFVKNDSIHVAELIELLSAYNKIVGDGHLQLTRKRDSSYVKLKKLFDYEFYTRFVDDGSVILSDTLVLSDSTTFYPGTKVLTFQGEPVEVIYRRLGAFIGLDDHNLASAKTYFPAQDPASFYQRLYGWKDSLVVELRTTNQKHRVTLIPSARMAYLNRDSTQQSEQVKAQKRTRKIKKAEQQERLEKLIRLDTTTHPDVYLFTIRTFSGKLFSRVNQYKHAKRVIERLNQENAQGLIIDVRNNTGGSLDFVNHIYSLVANENFYSGDLGLAYSERARGNKFFKKIGNTVFGGVRKKNGAYTKKSMTEKSKPRKGNKHFSGEVVTLVNETTFSGGTCFANYLQTYNRGKVVGQISGGSAERMYAGTIFKEPIGPEKTLLINMPLWYMDMPGDNRGNVTPDVIVPRNAEAVEAQRDETLEAAIKSFSFVPKE